MELCFDQMSALLNRIRSPGLQNIPAEKNALHSLRNAAEASRLLRHDSLQHEVAGPELLEDTLNGCPRHPQLLGDLLNSLLWKAEVVCGAIVHSHHSQLLSVGVGSVLALG